MKTIYTILCLLYTIPCINAGEVWVVTARPSVWAITQKPAKVLKVCACSKECTCGCNQGKECTCNQSGHNADTNRDNNPDKMTGFGVIRTQPDRIATCVTGY